MFDKNLFKIKVEFFMRIWHSCLAKLNVTKTDAEVQDLFTLFWHSALLQIWQTRTPGMILYGIDDPDTYNAFCDLVSLGMNQLNIKINELYAQGYPLPILLSKANVLIISRIHELADEVEELINIKTQVS